MVAKHTINVTVLGRAILFQILLPKGNVYRFQLGYPFDRVHVAQGPNWMGFGTDEVIFIVRGSLHGRSDSE